MKRITETISFLDFKKVYVILLTVKTGGIRTCLETISHLSALCVVKKTTLVQEISVSILKKWKSRSTARAATKLHCIRRRNNRKVIFL